MENKRDSIVGSIKEAREKGVKEELILKEIKRQNPDKESFFKKAEERGANATNILDEIVRQNTVEKNEEKIPLAAQSYLETSTNAYSEELHRDNGESPSPDDASSTAKRQKESHGTFLGLFSNFFIYSSGKKKIIAALSATAFLFFIFTWFFLNTPLEEDVSKEDISEFKLENPEIASITRPGIVKVSMAVKGEAVVPFFYLDLETVEIEKIPEMESYVIPIDTYLEGTGFVVTPDGGILTNAHVATTEWVKDYVMQILIMESIRLQMEYFGITEEREMEAFLKEAFADIAGDPERDDRERTKKMREEIFSGARFDIEKELKVFNPSSEKERLVEAVDEGFDAEILYAERNYTYNQKDIALIEIDLEDLPAIPLGDSNLVRSGHTVFSFGFPATSGILDVIMRKNNSNSFYLSVPNVRITSGYLNPSFVSGKVTALKENVGKEFDLIESDIKVSVGSSGSPVLNKWGEVVGIISFMANPGMVEGDVLVRSIPISLTEEIEEIISFNPSRGDYYEYLEKGLYFMHQRRCQRALQKFDLAIESTNENFLPEKEVKHFIKRCETLIESGGSVDTRWDLLKEGMGLK